MNDPAAGEQLTQIVGAAFAFGPAGRTDLLAAAVAARAPISVIDTLLRLPERSYHDIDDIRSALTAAP